MSRRSVADNSRWFAIRNCTSSNPDPGDWLMVRRNYQAWSYSPLTEITANNVRDLRLAWVWAMNDGGANEPTPIVHNGIIYLANTSNTVQALDGQKGMFVHRESMVKVAHDQRVDQLQFRKKQRQQSQRLHRAQSVGGVRLQ